MTHSRERRLEDLEAVVAAAGLERFALWGISAGTPAVLEYAAAHPDRVTHLVLYGAVLYKPVDEATYTATLALLREHFGSTEPAYREYFRALLFPDASDFETRVIAEFSGEKVGNGANAAAIRLGMSSEDMRPVASRIRVPTLVLHRRDDSLVPFRMGTEAAGLIPGARFESLGGRNHVFLPQDEEGEHALDLIEGFIASGPHAGGAAGSGAPE